MMSILLEILKSATPEERQAAVELLKPYLMVKEEKSQPVQMMNTKEFKKSLPIPKSEAWIRDILPQRAPILNQWIYGRHLGRGSVVRYDPAAVKWIKEHLKEIDWSG